MLCSTSLYICLHNCAIILWFSFLKELLQESIFIWTNIQTTQSGWKCLFLHTSGITILFAEESPLSENSQLRGGAHSGYFRNILIAVAPGSQKFYKSIYVFSQDKKARQDLPLLSPRQNRNRNSVNKYYLAAVSFTVHRFRLWGY